MKAAQPCRCNFNGCMADDSDRPGPHAAGDSFTVIAKILVGVAITLGAGVGLAPAASADPSPFSNLSCYCHLPPGPSAAIPDQVGRGIQDGLLDLQATRAISTVRRGAHTAITPDFVRDTPH